MTRDNKHLEQTLYHDLYHAAVSDARYSLSSMTMHNRLTIDLDHGHRDADPNLRNIRAIDLYLNHGSQWHGDRKTGCLKSIGNSHIARSLLLSATNLTHLRLRGGNHHDLAYLLRLPPMHHLQSLCLIQCGIADHTLIEILRDSGPSLRNFEIWCVLMETTSWHGVFDQLRESCPNLQELGLKMLGVHEGDIMYTLLFDDRMCELLVHATWQYAGAERAEDRRRYQMTVVGQQRVRDTVTSLSAYPWTYDDRGHTVFR